MATKQYAQWVRAGRPFRKAEPVKYMETYAKDRGIAVLGTLGNEAHLQAGFPEDHAPFSFTAWPVPLPDYVVTAIDLANDQGLGEAILRDARAGELPWLKYMNVAGRNYAYSDKFQEGSENADQHIHLSVFSDETWLDISGYDPLAGPSEEDTLSKHASDVIERAAVGLETDSVGGPIVWTTWRIRDEAWQAKVNKDLAELKSKPVEVKLSAEAEARIAVMVAGKMGQKLDLILSEMAEFRAAGAESARAAADKLSDHG